jgi:hypothetical protein
MKKPLTPVSDHAVLRYLERVLGLDVEAVRREIGHKVDLAQDHPGACGVVVAGFSYKIRDGVVTTVLQVNRPDPRLGRVRRERPE